MIYKRLLLLLATLSTSCYCYAFHSSSINNRFLVVHHPHPHPHPRHHLPSSSLICQGAYGRGAEIWPECNIDSSAYNIEGSFPDGKVPLLVDEEEFECVVDEEKSLVREMVRIVKEFKYSLIIPGVLLMGIVVSGLANVTDALFSLAISSYLILCYYNDSNNSFEGLIRMLSNKKYNKQYHLQSNLSDNPLGTIFSRSMNYQIWLRCGAIIGLFAPTLYLIKGSTLVSARAAARPLFLLCCQALTETVAKMSKASLPLRIIVPVVYNWQRLGVIWQWMLLDNNAAAVGVFGRSLAVLNMVYWTCNMFGFLLPIAVMRYLRAHFFTVEASEVTVREGYEDAVGLLPTTLI